MRAEVEEAGRAARAAGRHPAGGGDGRTAQTTGYPQLKKDNMIYSPAAHSIAQIPLRTLSKSLLVLKTIRTSSLQI